MTNLGEMPFGLGNFAIMAHLAGLLRQSIDRSKGGSRIQYCKYKLEGQRLQLLKFFHTFIHAVYELRNFRADQKTESEVATRVEGSAF